jgi:hypothetical protein
MLIAPGWSPPDPQVRLPAFGGGALFLEPHWGAAGWQDLRDSGLLVDIGLLDPLRYVCYRSRPCSADALTRLGAFLFDAANESHPERTLEAFDDRALGLVLSVMASGDFDVELEIQVAQDVDDGLVEFDGLNLRTTRAVLVSAAQQVPALSKLPGFMDPEAW